VARGQLRTDLDAELVIDLFAAPIIMRMLFGHSTLEPELPEQITRAVLRGVAPAHAPVCTRWRMTVHGDPNAAETWHF
jgi:hypothetical protein